MKKILVSAIIAVFLMMPISSFASTPISDNELDNISAQEGVSIYFGDMNLNGYSSIGEVGVSRTFPDSIAWGDPDGFITYDADENPLTYYDSSGYLGVKFTDNWPLWIGELMTVDIGTNAGVTKMKIALPVVGMIKLGPISITLKPDSTPELDSAQPALGTVFISPFAWGINTRYQNPNIWSRRGESITIASHTITQGLSMEFANVTLANPPTPISLSWSDTDGWGSASDYPTAGYAGFAGFKVGTSSGTFPNSPWTDVITLSNIMTVDMGTNPSGEAAMYIGLPTIKIGPATFRGDFKLADGQSLAGTQPAIGVMRIWQFGTTITGGGITIATH